MAKRRTGVIGAMSDLIRWTIWGLAGLFAVVLYMNWTKPSQLPGSDKIAVLPPADIAVQGSVDEVPAEGTAQEAEGSTEDVEEDVDGAEADPGDGETAGGDSEQVVAGADEIRVPGDDATYTLLNAFRRDDGSIEITTEKALDGSTTMTTRLVTCAPLAVGVIASDDGPRNDTPELERIPLGSAEASLAALACGAFR